MSRNLQRKIKRYICKCLQWLSLGGTSRDIFMCLLRGRISYSLFRAGITDYHTLSSLKNLPSHSSIEVQWPSWFLCSGSHQAKIKVLAGWTLFWEESTSKVIQVVGRIQSPVAVGLKFPFPCWLSSEVRSQLLEATGISWLMAFSVQIKPFSWFESLWGSLCLIFQSFTWHTLTDIDTQAILPVLSFSLLGSPFQHLQLGSPSLALLSMSLWLCFLILFMNCMKCIRKTNKTFHSPTFTQTLSSE